MESPIRILIVDDCTLMRHGLSLFFETQQDIVLVGEACSSSQAARCCEELRPDVVLMDLLLPGMGGVEAIHTISSAYPRTRIIALTHVTDSRQVRAAIKAGALSYLLKDISADELVEAVHAAYNGCAILCTEASQALVRAAQQPHPHHNLTPRQQQVLACMVQGLTNPEIANQLSISISTVKKHVSNILSTLDTGSRTRAVAVAVENQLVSA